MASKYHTIGSFNLHGLNQGFSMSSELCRTCCVIFVQEHWLLPNNLDCLSNLDDNFTAVATCSSAMDDVLGKGILRGRPFGGVAILVDNKLMNNFKLLHKSERLIAVKIKNCLFINIYFPVNAGNSNAYDDILLGIIGNIENIINDYNDCNVVLGGDFNLQFVGELSCRAIFNDFVKSSGLKLCDSKVIGPTRFTYLSEGNNCKSFIDHFFVDGALFEKVQSAEIIDSGMNLSDHLPLLLQFSDSLLDTRVREVHKNVKSGRIRWDKSDLDAYYCATNVYLGQIDPSRVFTNCEAGCMCEHGDGIDSVYSMIVDGLCKAAGEHCPKTTASHYKHYWDSELTDLKSKSIAAHDLWKACGRPNHGPIHDAKRCAKAEYKRAIRNKKSLEDAYISNDLQEYLLAKDTNSFWKTWQSEFKAKHKPYLCVDGYSDPRDIAMTFATNFKAACSPNTAEANDVLKKQFHKKFNCYNPDFQYKMITVELVDQCLRKMKRVRPLGWIALIQSI